MVCPDCGGKTKVIETRKPLRCIECKECKERYLTEEKILFKRRYIQ